MARLNTQEGIWTGSRYQWSRVVKPVGGRPEPTPPAQFTVPVGTAEPYTIRQGDRLDQMAFALLGDSRLWWVLVDLNREALSDTLVLEPGTQILIPTLQAVGGLA